MSKPKSTSNSIARFEALTATEKAVTVAVFDEEFVFEKARPLTATQRRDWNKFKKKAAQAARDGGERG